MAWNTEATRDKLLEAATAQFAAVGFAGARINTIATAAGINKERIYQYFGDKAGLFSAVLSTEVERLLDGIRIPADAPDALPTLAAALVDRAALHPHLARLLAWESLELDEPVSAETRTQGCAEMVTALTAAYPGLDRGRAADLLFSVIALSLADRCLPHLAALVTPTATTSTRRDAVIAQVTGMAAALQNHP